MDVIPLLCVPLLWSRSEEENGLHDLRDGAMMILHVECKKFLHLLLRSSLLAFLERLAYFFKDVIEQRRDDVLVADLGSSHGVEYLSLDLTRDST
jgi:hypothetical protein